jgi:hypothetical protein
MPLVVTDLSRSLKLQLLSIPIHAFELEKTCNDVGLSVYGTKSSRSHKPGGACTDSFDRPRFEWRFFYENTGKRTVRHKLSFRVRGEEMTLADAWLTVTVNAY